MSRVRVKKQPGQLAPKPDSVKDLEKIAGRVRVADKRFTGRGSLRKSFSSTKKGRGFSVSFGAAHASSCDGLYGTFVNGRTLKQVLDNWVRY